MIRKKGISLKELAASLNVSTSLVSAVINGKAKQYRISEKMEKRVLAAAKEMNYYPNIVAQSLRGGKSRLIGVVITDISNPFYSAISRIIEDRSNELNYTVLLSSSDEDLKNTERLVNILIGKGVDGLIVVPCDGSKEMIADLHNDKFPLVLVDRHFPDLDVSFSCLDNYKATTLATQHLIDQGYENISVVSYETKMNHIVERVAGYEDSMNKAGYGNNINIRRINLSNPRFEMYEALEYLIKKGTDAVICLTNMLSINGIYCLNEMKLEIPKDIAFVGFNRSDVFNLLHSPITFIRQPLEQIANEAINVLMDKIDNGDNAVRSNSVANPELIIQNSTPKKDK